MLFNLFSVELSQKDIDLAKNRLGQMPIEIGVAKIKFGFLFVLSLFLVAITLKNGNNDLVLNSNYSLIFLLAAGFFAFMLSPYGPKLRLDENGFEAKNLIKSIKKNWYEIDGLRAMKMQGNKFITWKNARDPIVDKPEGVFSKIVGYSGVFNNIYDISNRELLALMILIKNTNINGAKRMPSNYQPSYTQYNNGIINSFGRRTN